MQLRHVGIVCRDLQKSLQFYQDIFECRITRRMGEAGSFISTILGLGDVQVETVKLSCPQGTTEIELLSFTKPMMENSTSLLSYGLTHVALKVNNIEVLYEKMSQAHIPCVSKPEISPDGKAKVFFCQDPNGVFLEIVEIISS